MDEANKMELADNLVKLSASLIHASNELKSPTVGALPTEMVGAFNLAAVLKIIVTILTQVLPLIPASSGSTST